MAEPANGRRGLSFNAQTLLGIIAIAGTLVAWGYTLSGLQRDTDRNTAAVAQLTLGLERNDGKTAQLELRMQNVEKLADDAAELRRELHSSIAQVKSDIAVVKEILQRLEQERRRPPPSPQP